LCQGRHLLKWRRLQEHGEATREGRKARPSSGHPGIVNAAFVDGSVRSLQESMDKTLFVRLARPGSGVIINPKDLGW